MAEHELENDIVDVAPRRGKIAMIVDYVTSARKEMEKVTWPTKEELTNSTRLVIIGSIGLGIVIGGFDWLLGKVLVNGVAMLSQ